MTQFEVTPAGPVPQPALPGPTGQRRHAAWSLPTIVRALFCSLGLFALPSVSQAAAVNGVMAPLSLDFGTVPVGATSVAQTLTFVNTSSAGTQKIDDLSNYVGDYGGGGLNNNSGDFAIGPCNGIGGISRSLFNFGARCTYTVTFTPTAAGSRSGTLRFNTEDSGQFSIPATGTGVTPASSIAIDPVTPATLYAGLDGGGVYKKVGAGNWTAATTQPTNLNVKALTIKSDSSILFAGTDGAGVFKSLDAGVTWAACANTNLTNLNLRSLALAGASLYAGTTAGVFVSTDSCANWTALNTGMP